MADTESELAANLANLRLANSAAPEFSSIEQLEAAQYGQTYSRPEYSQYAQVRSVRSLQQHSQVRPSRSLHFPQVEEERSHTWNQQSVSRYRQESEYYPARHKRLSVSSFRYEDTGDTTSPSTPSTTEQRNAFKQKVQRSLSCERTKHASKQVVKSIKISSDKIQENLTKISSNLNSKLDTRLSSLSCIAGEEEGVAGTDWYRPRPTLEDSSGGFRPPVRLTTPTNSLGSRGRQHNQIPQSPTTSVFSCTKPQVLLSNRPPDGWSQLERSPLMTVLVVNYPGLTESLLRLGRREEGGFVCSNIPHQMDPQGIFSNWLAAPAVVWWWAGGPTVWSEVSPAATGGYQGQRAAIINSLFCYFDLRYPTTANSATHSQQNKQISPSGEIMKYHGQPRYLTVRYHEREGKN